MYILSTHSYIQIYVCTYNVYTSTYRYIQEYTSSEYVHTRHIHVHRWYIQIFVYINFRIHMTYINTSVTYNAYTYYDSTR